MKTLKRFLTIAVAALAFTACNNNDNAENMLFDWQIDENWVQSNGNFSDVDVEEFLIGIGGVKQTKLYWYQDGKPYYDEAEVLEGGPIWGFIFTEEVCYLYWTYLSPTPQFYFAKHSWNYERESKALTITWLSKPDRTFSGTIQGLSEEKIIIDGCLCTFDNNRVIRLKDGTLDSCSNHGIYPRYIMEKGTYQDITLEKLLTEGIEMPYNPN